MSESEQARLHAIVEGHVQGVGFRAFVLDRALELGLTGWVRNRWDGTVEVMAEGSKSELEKLLAALRRGPRSYTTSGVRPEWLDITQEFTRFQVRMTSG
jgi:acylphosphatase